MALKLINIIRDSFINSSSRPVMKITVAVSFIAHIFLIIGMQTIYPVYWKNEELRSYRVDLMRMEVKDLPEGTISETTLENSKKEDEQTAQLEETISLDTKDKRYISYASAVKREIMKNWRYPSEARAYLLEGTSLILFSILQNGEIDTISITGSSGHAVLDMEAVRAVKQCVPFPAFPSSIRVQKLNINAAFEYRLTSSRNSGDKTSSDSLPLLTP